MNGERRGAGFCSGESDAEVVLGAVLMEYGGGV